MRESNMFSVDVFDLFQVAFIVLKLAGIIDWSWWKVFLPYEVSIVAVLVLILVRCITANKMPKEVKK